MAVFKPLIISKDENLEKLSRNLYVFGEELRYTFSNLDYENLSQDVVNNLTKREELEMEIRFDTEGLLLRFENTKTGALTSLEQSMEQIELKINKGDVVSELNTRIGIYNESIELSTGQITIDTNNFKIDAAGNATFTGKVTGGSINIGDKFKVDGSGNLTINDFLTEGNMNPTRAVYADELIVYNYDYKQINIAGHVAVNGETTVNQYLYAHELIFFSDQRLKTNIKSIENAMDVINNFSLKSYTYKNTGQPGIGYIAQEVERDDLPIVKEKKYKMITYATLTALYIKAIQENQERINKIKEELWQLSTLHQ